MTPKSRHDAKVVLALQWTGVMGWTTGPLIRQALGVRSNNFPMLLRSKGLLDSTEIPGLPFGLFWLTAEGRDLASMYLERPVSAPARMDKLGSSYLSHDLMTQQALLASLEGIAQRNSSAVDLGAFLHHARESRDLVGVDSWSRPDILYVNPDTNVAYGLECERSQKGQRELNGKMHRLLRFAGSQGFSHFAVEFAIRGSKKTIDRYRRVWADVLEEAVRDGLSLEDATRVNCRFRAVESYLGTR